MKIITQTINYLRQSKAELSKVVWPSRKEVTRYTVVVILAMIVATAIVTVFDIGLIKAVQFFVIK